MGTGTKADRLIKLAQSRGIRVNENVGKVLGQFVDNHLGCFMSPRTPGSAPNTLTFAHFLAQELDIEENEVYAIICNLRRVGLLKEESEKTGSGGRDYRLRLPTDVSKIIEAT